MGDREEDEQQTIDSGGMNITKYPVMASLVALQQMRNRLHLAFLGRKLMKWTVMATAKELRRLAQEIEGYLMAYREEVKDAYMSLARCRYFIDHVSYIVIETLPPKAIITVNSTSKSISGVKVRNMNVVEIGVNGYQYLGLACGGMAVRAAREAWLALIKKMVFICQLKISFGIIAAAHKNATKKENVLKRNIIPRILLTMKYILSELEEREREETFRLKRFKQLKYKDITEEIPSQLPAASAALARSSSIMLPLRRPSILPMLSVPPPPSPPFMPPPPPPSVTPRPLPVITPSPMPVIAKKTTIIEPLKEDEPPEVPDNSSMTPLEIPIIPIMKGIKPIEEVEKAEIPTQDSGLAQYDQVRLKSELWEIIERRLVPDEDKMDSPCSCRSSDLEKRAGLQAAQSLMPKTKVKTIIPDYIMTPRRPAEAVTTDDDRLELLDNNVDQVICMTNFYQGQGLLSKSAEDFIKCCRSVKIKIQEFKNQRTVIDKLDALKQQVIKLQRITDTVQNPHLSATAITSFKLCCKEFMDKLESRKSCRGAPSVHSIEKLINQIGDSIALSNKAKNEGLVSESVEQFIASCKEIQSKIQPQENTPKPQVIDDLIININDITEFISKYKNDGLMSESIEQFYVTCKITKEKLDSYKPPSATPGDQQPSPGDQQPTPGDQQPTPGDQEPTSANQEPTPPKQEPAPANPPPCGKSTCPRTKSRKYSFPVSRTPPKPVCTKSTCTQKNAHQGPRQAYIFNPHPVSSTLSSKPICNDLSCISSKFAKSQDNKPSHIDSTSIASTFAKTQDFKPSRINTKCTSSKCGKAQDSKAPRIDSKCVASTSPKYKDSQPPCIDSTCNVSTCAKSRDSKPSCSDVTCIASTCTNSQDTVTCNDFSCRASMCKGKMEKQKSQRSYEDAKCTDCPNKTPKQVSQRSYQSSKSSKIKCNESTCTHKLSKQESQQSGKSQSSQDHQITYVCIQEFIKPLSRHLYKSDSYLINAPEYVKPNWSQCTPQRPLKHSWKSCSAIGAPIEGKNKKDPTGGKCSTFTTPEKWNHNSCDLCSSRSQSNISLKIVPVIKEKKKHNAKGRKSGKCGVPDTSKDSCSNLSAARSKSGTSSSVSAPIAGQGRKECYGKTVGTLKTVKRYEEKDGSVIEETEKVIVKHRIFGPDEKPSETSSYATGSCQSVQSTRTVNVCEVPMRGFIQTVRNVKSETLIRSLNLSHPYPPLAWSCVSVDSVAFGGGHNGNMTVEQDPFFCGSPTTSDDGSELCDQQVIF